MNAHRICPRCRGKYCIPIVQISAHGDVLVGEMVRCAHCSDMCHWTHWKTPDEHDARKRSVARICADIDAGHDTLCEQEQS